jgi:hypothetical protein
MEKDDANEILVNAMGVLFSEAEYGSQYSRSQWNIKK